MVRMLGIAAAGGALEFYDFVIFVFFADIISVLFFPPGLPRWLATMQTFGIFATGYVFRPLGGIVLAHFGDLFGRKRVFAFSILLMAASTLCVGLLPSYKMIGPVAPVLLVLLRITQGIAIGGEVPGAWIFVAEHVPHNRRAVACALVCAGLSVGVFVGAGLSGLLSLVLSPASMLEFGWRIPFLLGGLFGLVAVRLRRMLHETPIFVALRARRVLVPELPIGVVIRTHLRGVAISAICTWILSGSVVILTLMVPTILQGAHHFERSTAMISTTTSSIFLGVGVMVGGLVYDRVGAGWFFLLGGGLLAVGGCAFFSIAMVELSYVYALSALIGFCGAIIAGVPVAMVSCFPPAVRFSGVSFSYNVTYAVAGGTTPVMIAMLLNLHPQSHVFYLFAISVLAVCLGIYFLAKPDVLRYGAD